MMESGEMADSASSGEGAMSPARVSSGASAMAAASPSGAIIGAASAGTSPIALRSSAGIFAKRSMSERTVAYSASSSGRVIA